MWESDWVLWDEDIPPAIVDWPADGGRGDFWGENTGEDGIRIPIEIQRDQSSLPPVQEGPTSAQADPPLDQVVLPSERIMATERGGTVSTKGREQILPVRWVQEETRPAYLVNEGVEIPEVRMSRPNFTELSSNEQETIQRQPIEPSVRNQSAGIQPSPSIPISAHKWGTPVFVLGIFILILTVVVLIVSKKPWGEIPSPNSPSRRPK